MAPMFPFSAMIMLNLSVRISSRRRDFSEPTKILCIFDPYNYVAGDLF